MKSKMLDEGSPLISGFSSIRVSFSISSFHGKVHPPVVILARWAFFPFSLEKKNHFSWFVCVEILLCVSCLVSVMPIKADPKKSRKKINLFAVQSPRVMILLFVLLLEPLLSEWYPRMTEVLIDPVPQPPPPPILSCTTPCSSPFHRHHRRQLHIHHQSTQQSQQQQQQLAMASSRESLRSREEDSRRQQHNLTKAATCPEERPSSSSHSPSCKLYGNHRISSRLTSQGSTQDLDAYHREIHMIIRDHSLTKNQTSSSPTATPTAQQKADAQVNDLNASPTRGGSSCYHENSMPRKSSSRQPAQQHSCCSPPPSPLLIPEQDCSGFTQNPAKKPIRRIHFCPEFLKAMESVQFIAAHTKKSEEDVDVSTFSLVNSIGSFLKDIFVMLSAFWLKSATRFFSFLRKESCWCLCFRLHILSLFIFRFPYYFMCRVSSKTLLLFGDNLIIFFSSSWFKTL